MPFFPRSRKSGSGRRREDDGVEAITFELESLEFVQASDEVGLLRVGGTWFAPVSRALADIVLSVDRDTERLELAPLPDMNGVAPVASPAGEEWRGAFTMTVEVAEDPRTEFALVAGGDGEVALPRPSEWDEMQREELEPEVAPEPQSPVVAELVAKLEEVARLDGPREPEPGQPQDPDQREPALARESLPEPDDVLHPALGELADLRGELDVHRLQLAAAQSELDAERRRSAALEQELRSHVSVEEDLRNAIAMQEAEMASAVAQASQRARQAEQRRDLVPSDDGGDDPERPRSRPLDEEFLARLERARRASEAVAG
jgi:hypothetical protein